MFERGRCATGGYTRACGPDFIGCTRGIAVGPARDRARALARGLRTR
jgi:hypothetical protein